MLNNNSSLNFSIVNTIKEIAKEDWDRLFGKDIIEDHGYQKTLEEAKLKEFSFGYLLGKRDKNLIAIIPFFVMDFSFDTLIRGLLHRLMLKLKKIFTLKILFLGSPTTEEFYLGISKSEDLTTILNKALEKVYEFCKGGEIKGFLFYNISEKNKPLAEYLTKKRFIKMEGLPTTLIKINANSLEDYIKDLSKNTRKDLRRKLRRSTEEAQLTTELREDISDIACEIYKLYLNNFDESSVHFEILTQEFFQNICHNMPRVAKFFVTYDKDEIVAFNLALIKGDLFIDKFIGLDLNVAHKYHLYFTTFCHNIDWCIKNGLRFYQPGATDYYPKIRLGAELIPLYIYAKALNPMLNAFIRSISRLIEPKNIDSTLKDIKECKKD